MRLLRSLAALGLAALVDCGGGGSAPSAAKPTSSAPTAVSGLNVTTTPQLNNGTVAEFAWSGGSGSTSFILEAGSRSGASDVATIDTQTGATSYTWTGVPIGTLYARVHGRNGTGAGTSSNEVVVGSVDPRDVIDALFLGSGRLAVAGNLGCAVSDAMAGWRYGTSVQVLVSTSVSDAQFQGIQQTVAQFPTVTLDTLHGGIGRVADPVPSSDTDQITITNATQAEIDALCRRPGATGCALTFISRPFTRAVRIVALKFPDGDAFGPSIMSHELGHALGLCHIISAAGLLPEPVMGLSPDAAYAAGRTWPLEGTTIRAMQSVYRAGLTAGATRRLFIAAGLVPDNPSGLSRRPAGAEPAATVVDNGYGDVEIIKPFCLKSPPPDR